MSARRPKLLHIYSSPIMNSARWEGFDPRPDDILVCTSYKAGTTWMQMICALLVRRMAREGNAGNRRPEDAVSAPRVS